MKTLFFIGFLLTAVSAVGQQHLTATAVDEAAYIFQDEDEQGDPIGEKIFLGGCSWYCGGYVKDVTVSSALTTNKSIDYQANNAHDFDYTTAWIEGKDNYGVGEYIEYAFNFDTMKNYSGSMGITTLIIANGYQKSKAVWENNARIKQVKMFVDDTEYATIDLIDHMGIQTVAVGDIYFPENTTTYLRFQITEVYPGKKYKDTALSLLMFDGLGVH